MRKMHNIKMMQKKEKKKRNQGTLMPLLQDGM